MAKAREIEGLRPDMPFAEAAAATVAVRAEELFEHAANVLDTTDIERVHDMRVASRRLRAVLEIYAPCFPREQFKPLLKEVKALADALGERRDPDVLLDRLSTLEDALPKASRPGIEAFAAPVRAAQDEGNAILAAALEHAERAGLRDRLALLAASAVEPEPPEAADEPQPLATAQAEPEPAVARAETEDAEAAASDRALTP
jgi:CHAD domain-containing protein